METFWEQRERENVEYIRQRAKNVANDTITRIMTADNKIPFLSGRPVRDTVIGQDDIINLRIALNSAKTLEQFLETV
jgi:hypothetical protein